MNNTLPLSKGRSASILPPTPGRTMSHHNPIRLALALATASLLLASGAVQAAFHLWNVEEVYSSADGSVQYIKLTNNFASEYFLAGHAITVSGPAGTHSFTFPTNMPSSPSTVGRSMLIGTANLATLPGGVVPDYVLTNTQPFLFINPGGATTVGISGAAVPAASYTSLPTDGQTALAGQGASLGPIVNSLVNFAGASNSIVPVRFSSALAQGTNFVLSFRTATGINGSAGPNYSVDYSDLLAPPAWTPLATVPGDGTAKSVSNALSLAPQRFFRLHVP